jgi:hypothetical protein
MAKKANAHKKGLHQELHPMLLKGIILGLVLGLGWMLYVNILRSKYDMTTENAPVQEQMMDYTPKASDSKMMKETKTKGY